MYVEVIPEKRSSKGNILLYSNIEEKDTTTVIQITIYQEHNYYDRKLDLKELFSVKITVVKSISRVINKSLMRS